MRALEDPAGGGARHRRLGAAAPQGSGSFPTDIALTSAAPARLSAYFVDFAATPWGDGQSPTARSQEVYLLTGYPALNPAAPRAALEDFAGGVWMTWEVEGDIRVRISTIRGDYAVLSAIAFDPA